MRCAFEATEEDPVDNDALVSVHTLKERLLKSGFARSGRHPRDQAERILRGSGNDVYSNELDEAEPEPHISRPPSLPMTPPPLPSRVTSRLRTVSKDSKHKGWERVGRANEIHARDKEDDQLYGRWR